MDGKEGAVRDGDMNIQNCFLKTVQIQKSVQEDLRGKKTLRYLFCIARVDANLSFSRN